MDLSIREVSNFKDFEFYPKIFKFILGVLTLTYAQIQHNCDSKQHQQLDFDLDSFKKSNPPVIFGLVDIDQVALIVILKLKGSQDY